MAQKGLIDPNVERNLKHFAEQKNTAFSERRRNNVIGWFRPVVGRIIEAKLPPNSTGKCPPNTTFEVWITNPDSKERARATVTTDGMGTITSISVNPSSQGAGFLMGDECTLSPVDGQLNDNFPEINSIGTSPSKLSWEGGLQTEEDLIKIHTAFETDIVEGKLIEAFNPDDSGNSSDGIVLPLQIDYMAQAERAYRSRATHTFPRTLAHLSTREKGHGQQTGVFLGQALDYFVLLLKQGASSTGGQV
jgi:hypothetical protein